MTKFKSKKLLVFIMIVLIIGVGTAAAARAAKNNNLGVAVEVAAATKGDIIVKVPANGVLEEVEKKLVYYDGSSRVKSVEVELGQRVTKGQLLAVVDTVDLNGKINISKEQQEIERISLDKLEKTRIDAINNSKSVLTEARLTLDRNKELFEKGAISQVEFEKLQKACDVAEKDYQQYLKNEDSLYYDIQKMYKQLNISQLSLKDLQEQQQKQTANIISPIDGIITQRNLEAGAFTNPATPAFVVSNIEALEIKINVSEYDIAKVHIGQEVEIVTDAMGDKTFKGTVEKIAPVANRVNTGQSTETVVSVTIKVLESHEFLKPGFTVKTRIISDKKENTLLVPFDALLTEKNGMKHIFVVKDGIAIKRDVQIGIESDFNIEIIANLEVGEEIVLNPSVNLKDGDKVSLKAKK